MSAHLPAAIALMERLVACPTVSSDSNLALIDDLADRLETCGARVEVFRNETSDKANLFATLGPERAGGLVLSGHTDVVPVTDQDWSSDPFALREADGLYYGRGTCDMKGFIAAAVALAPEFAKIRLERPIHFAFTYDEEIGCLGGRALAVELANREARPALALIGEPTGMQVIEGHKGCCEYTVHFHGLEGHGSRPEAGVNAAEYAVRYAAELLALRPRLMARAPVDSPFDPPWTTLNIGAIRAGVAHNVIANKAELDWEMRPVQAADAAFVKMHLSELVEKRLLPDMRAVHAASDIVTEIIGEVAGLSVMPENAARDLVAGLLGANGAATVPFGTEAGLFQEIGMDVVICGPGSIDQAHKADEFVSAEQMARCLGLLERLGAAMAA
jgi:acetylornithine deacetylase